MTLYEILRVLPSVSEKQIHASYRALASELHPDVNPAPDAAEQFKRLKAAHDVLGDAGRRAAYDATLKLPRTAIRRDLARRAMRVPVWKIGTAGVAVALVLVAPRLFPQGAASILTPPAVASVPTRASPSQVQATLAVATAAPATPYAGPTPEITTRAQPIPTTQALPPLVAQLRARATSEYPRALALVAAVGAQPKLVFWEAFYFEQGMVPELGGRAGMTWTFEVLGGRQSYEIAVGYAPTGARLTSASSRTAALGSADLWRDDRVFQLMTLMEKEQPASTVTARPALVPSADVLASLFEREIPRAGEAEFMIDSYFYSATALSTGSTDPYYWATSSTFTRYQRVPQR